MTNIKKNDAFYKRLSDRRNKSNLKRRTKAKLRNKRIKTYQIRENQKYNEEQRDNREPEKKIFMAEKNFSLFANSESTIAYFNEVITYIKGIIGRRKHVHFEMKDVKTISIDSIMYLLAIISNLRTKFVGRCHFSGDVPDDRIAKGKMLSSGFHKYVQMSSKVKLDRNSDNVQIKTGYKNNPDVAAEICEFAIKQSKGKKRKDFNFLYCMLSELMFNTKDHAYNKSEFEKTWYLYVEKSTNHIRFSFLDIGEGIPSTVNKKWHEKLRALGIVSDSDLIISSLKGDFKRTQTKKDNRGRGLPSIFESKVSKQIDNLRIISGKGKVEYSEHGIYKEELTNSMRGTLVSWTIEV